MGTAIQITRSGGIDTTLFGGKHTGPAASKVILTCWEKVLVLVKTWYVFDGSYGTGDKEPKSRHSSWSVADDMWFTRRECLKRETL